MRSVPEANPEVGEVHSLGGQKVIKGVIKGAVRFDPMTFCRKFFFRVAIRAPTKATKATSCHPFVTLFEILIKRVIKTVITVEIGRWENMPEILLSTE